MNCLLCNKKLSIVDYGFAKSLICKCDKTDWRYPDRIILDKDNNIIEYGVYLLSDKKKYHLFSSKEENYTMLNFRPNKHSCIKVMLLEYYIPINYEKDLKEQVYELFHRLMKLAVFL